MSGGLFRSERDDGNLQSFTNDSCDVSGRHSLFGHCVIPNAAIALFERQPKQMSRVNAVRHRPAVASVAAIRRNSLFAGNLDRIRYQALLHRVID
jgi:hypothetical protein